MRDVCAAGNGGPLLSVQAAQHKIAASLQPVEGLERLTLEQALGRALAENVIAPIDLPFERNAAMDGYALNHLDVDPAKGCSLTLAGTSWAGHPYRDVLQRGQCIRIFTGAVLPEGADCVVMQEKAEVNQERILFPADVKAWQNVRQPGEDAAKGSMLLAAPKRLSPIDIALLAAAGVTQATVKRRLRIAYFSTGDELSPLGRPLESGKIYDSNCYMLHGLLQDASYTAENLGVVADDKKLLQKTLTEAATRYDAIISTGGASVGEADYIQEILAAIGHVEFWKIAMKPGKPFAFGYIGNCRFFGLPGNPLAVLATYQQLVAPALRALSGITPAPSLRIKAVCTSVLKKARGRREFQRGIFRATEDGNYSVAAAGGQGSHMLAAASSANCYIVLPEDNGGVQPGEEVLIEPFVSFGQ